jgi:hypothetical protein
MRECCQDLAAEFVFRGDNEAMVEAVLFCAAMTREAGGTDAERFAAWSAEWPAMCERARLMQNGLRTRIWPLARMDADGKRIMAEAKVVAFERDIGMAPETLRLEARKIARTAIVQKSGRKRKYARPFAR